MSIRWRHDKTCAWPKQSLKLLGVYSGSSNLAVANKSRVKKTYCPRSFFEWIYGWWMQFLVTPTYQSFPKNIHEQMFSFWLIEYTLSPIIMDMKNGCIWKVTTIVGGGIFHFHDYGRNGTFFCSICLGKTLGHILRLRLFAKAYTQILSVDGV